MTAVDDDQPKRTKHLGSTWHPFSAIQSQVSTKQLEERDAFLLKYFVASKKQCKTGLTTAVNCNQQREGGISGFNLAPTFYHLLYNRDAFLLKYFIASKKQCKTGLTTAVNYNQQREGGIIGFNPAPISYHLPYNLTLLIENISINQQKEG